MFNLQKVHSDTYLCYKMPVFLTNNEQLQEFSYSKITNDKKLCEKSEEFFKNKVEKLGPNNCLYIGQREFATVRYSDEKIDLIGIEFQTYLSTKNVKKI